jgi:hypothetical protein
LDVGIFFGGFVAATLQNGGKMQTRHSANHRGVKRAPRQPESDEAHFNHRRSLFLQKLNAQEYRKFKCRAERFFFLKCEVA